MAILYHLDTAKTIKDDYIFPSLSPQNYKISKLFPEISFHGSHYLLHEELDYRSVMCEWVLEYVRMTMFPKMPSRFKCLFASKTKNETLRWAEYWNKTDYNIVEIETNDFYELDCSWFTDLPNLRTPQPNHHLPQEYAYPKSTARTFEAAVKYWNGEHSDNPRLEILIPLPCQVKNIYRQSD